MGTAFTVGKVDAGIALLLTTEQQLIEFPSALLPRGIGAGSIVNISIARDRKAESQVLEEFYQLQEEILRDFSQLPEPPTIKVRRATQSSLIVQWSGLELHRADLKRVQVLRDKLTANYAWINETSVKIHGLKMDTEYEVQVIFDTTAGTVRSNTIRARTHTLADLTGVYVVFDGFDDNQAAQIKELRDLKELLRKVGADYTDEVGPEVTHLVYRGRKAEETKIVVEANGKARAENARDLNIPIVTPEWVRACYLQQKLKNASEFYVI